MNPKESSMKPIMQNERGMALAVAIFALVIVGALVAGALFAGTQEQRVGETSRRLTQSFGVAELGIYDVMRNWTASTYNTRGVYATDSVAVNGTTPKATGSYAGYVYRLNNEVYLIDVSGHDTVSGSGSYGGGRARQRIGMLGRIRTLALNVRGSLTSERSDVVKGNAQINGYDQAPPAWTSCGTLQSAVAGIQTGSGDTVSVQGSATILGSPPVRKDSTVTDSTFTHFGGVTYAQLVSQANITVPGGTYSSVQPAVTGGGQCDQTNMYNWGDGANPTGPCGAYFPIIHVAGDLHLTGVQGQGILLVDGSLTITGSFQFFGVTIIRGTLTAAGGGSTAAHFWGATMVQDSVQVGDNSIAGHANINYSSCAILQALDKTGVVTPMRSRGWIQLF
jgi:hypothetical protein